MGRRAARLDSAALHPIKIVTKPLPPSLCSCRIRWYVVFAGRESARLSARCHHRDGDKMSSATSATQQNGELHSMPVPTKRDLRICLLVWGLRVEGNESQDELYEAYIWQSTYRESTGLSTELREAVERYHPGMRPDPAIARYGRGERPHRLVPPMSSFGTPVRRANHGVPA